MSKSSAKFPDVPLHVNSELFLVRLWLENLGEGRTEWRGKAQCIADGETRYFNTWQMLADFMIEKSTPPI